MIRIGRRERPLSPFVGEGQGEGIREKDDFQVMMLSQIL